MGSLSARASTFPAASSLDVNSFSLRFFLSWTAFLFLSRYPGYVHFDTAEIFAWSTLGFEGGFVKHPPLMPWLVHAVNFVFPENWITFAFLSTLNVTLGIYAAWRVAALTIGEARAPFAAALYMLSVYTVWHGLKFNHNSILLSAWPLTVWAFLLCLREPTWWRGAILAVAAALSVYAKYNTVLLLVALFVASLVSVHRRDFYRSPAPYVSLTLFLAIMAPHVLWEYQHKFQTTQNANSQRAEIGALPKRLLAENFSRLLPVLAAFAVFYKWLGRSKPKDVAHWHELLAIVFVPFLLTVGITMVLGLRGSHSWTTPVYCFVPIALAGLIGRPNADQLALLNRVFNIAFLVIPIVGAVKLVTDFRNGNEKATDPIPEITRLAEDIWHSTIGTPVVIAAGEHRYSVGASLAMSDHPRAWTSYRSYWWITPSLVDEKGALGFCRQIDKDCMVDSERLVAERNGWSCKLTMHRTLYGIEGPPHTISVYFLPPRSFKSVLTPEQRCPHVP
jgi:hypothetical protein